MIAEAQEVVAVAALAEHDRSVCRVEQLASAAGASVRTLQRLFDFHVGASPSFVIRRWRIIEAAEAARRASDDGNGWRGWAAIAAELGYSDQAHLTRISVGTWGRRRPPTWLAPPDRARERGG